MNDYILPYDIRPQHDQLRNELMAIMEKVYTNGIFVGGEEIKQFEKDFGMFLNMSDVVSCASGTDALELILRACELQPADEILVPVNTWISDSEVVKLTGGTLRFVDVDEETGNVVPETIQSQITSRSKALIVVHMHGRMADMQKIKTLAGENHLILIEDCAHAAGAVLEDQRAGSWGDFSAFSFYPTKNLGALGDGGAVVCQQAEMAKKLRLLANHGQPERDIHILEGKTSRLDTLQAAFLSEKLKWLEGWNQERVLLAEKYSEQLNSIRDICVPKPMKGGVYHHYVIRLKERDALRKFLHENGIGTGIHYPNPLHRTPAYDYLKIKTGSFPAAERRAREILSLPMYPGLTTTQVKRITNTIKLFMA